MIRLFGPKVPRYHFDEELKKMVEDDGFLSNAVTLHEILIEYGRSYKYLITPYVSQCPNIGEISDKNPKYFWLEDKERSMVVDIHIERNDKDICAKQNVQLDLFPGDKVILGPLAC